MGAAVKLPKPKAVIFDWDDTIVNTWYAALEALNTSFRAMGAPEWSDEEARAKAGASARDMFKSLFGDRWQEADKIYIDTYVQISAEKVRLLEDAEAVLKALHEAEVYLAIVSNKRGALLRKEATHLNLDRYFGRIVGAGDAKADKPDPAHVHMALENSGISAGQDVWFVGDSHTDMLCASNSGCVPILIETKPPPEEQLAKNPPILRFLKHYDLMEFIKTHYL
jgi:phosphoglycolate phosphatase